MTYDNGTCKRFNCDWPEKLDEIVKFPNPKMLENLPFTDFSHNMIIDVDVLYGCDYSSPLPHMGFHKAHKLIEKYKLHKSLFQHFLKTGRKGFNDEYVKSFERAVAAFKFAMVYDSQLQIRTPLTFYKGDITPCLGARLPDVEDEIHIVEWRMPTCHISYSARTHVLF